MILPELEWQLVYGRVAWLVILATFVAALLPVAWRNSRTKIRGLLLGTAALMALPGEFSPSYWLVLAFQWPSGVLLGYCLLRLRATGPGKPGIAFMPAAMAAVIAPVGAVLYLDAIGVLSLGLYYRGFGPTGAPVLAMAAALACAFLIVRGRARPAAIILLAAVALFSVLRLPTGNLWDTLLDPLLWVWAVLSLAIAGGRRLVRALRRPPLQTGPALVQPDVAGI